MIGRRSRWRWSPLLIALIVFTAVILRFAVKAPPVPSRAPSASGAGVLQSPPPQSGFGPDKTDRDTIGPGSPGDSIGRTALEHPYGPSGVTLLVHKRLAGPISNATIAAIRGTSH